MATTIPRADIVKSEDYNMRRANRYISLLFLAAALAAPVAVMAAPAPQVALQVRVYDKHHKDYHVWDDNENRSYMRFRESHRQYNVTFARTSSRQQAAYWNWRHAHPDRN